MDIEIAIVRPGSIVGNIKAAFNESGQSMFPVLDDENVFIGTVWANELTAFLDSDTAQDVLDSRPNSFKLNPYVLDSQPLKYAKQFMGKNRLAFLPVISQDRKYIGTVDASS